MKYRQIHHSQQVESNIFDYINDGIGSPVPQGNPEDIDTIHLGAKGITLTFYTHYIYFMTDFRK
jgi:hypothetical protein